MTTRGAELIGSTALPALRETLRELRDCGESSLGLGDEIGLAGAVSWTRQPMAPWTSAGSWSILVRIAEASPQRCSTTRNPPTRAIASPGTANHPLGRQRPHGGIRGWCSWACWSSSLRVAEGGGVACAKTAYGCLRVAGQGTKAIT